MRRPMVVVSALLASGLPGLSLASQVVLEFTNVVGSQVPISSDAQIQHQLESELLSLYNKPKACGSCQSVLAPLKSLAYLGDERFVNALTAVCKVRKLAEPEQCEGDISAQGPILAHDLRNIAVNGISATRLCNALFGLCDQPPVTPFEVKFPKPRSGVILNSADGGKRKNRKEERRPPFQVVHVSDVHIDREYTVGAEADCDKWICCRNFDSSKSTDPNNVTSPAGPYGNFRCDTPVPLAHSMLDAVRSLVPNAQFTISTGDVVDHANWLVTQDTVTGSLHEFHKMLRTNLTTTFYGSLGNHDSFPTNAFVRDGSSTDESSEWVFDLIGKDWMPWIGKDGANAIRHHSGSYSVVHPGTKLKVIAINTQYWYKFNLWIYDSDEFIPDPNSIIAFLIDELQTAEDAGQRAWIFGHIPPGVSDTMHDQSNYYNQIVKRYRDTIAGQFFGHTHFDSFQVAYADYKNRTAENAMSFGLIAPSLTPTNGHPAFTVYDVDPDTYDIMDKKVYISNMSDPHFQTKPTWHLLYSARSSYAPLISHSPSSPLDATFWHALTSTFIRNDTAFEQYRNRMVRDAWEVKCGKEEDEEARKECKERVICGMRAMRSEDNCDTPGGIIGRWDVEEGHAHSCEGSALPDILQGLLNIP